MQEAKLSNVVAGVVTTVLAGYILWLLIGRTSPPAPQPATPTPKADPEKAKPKPKRPLLRELGGNEA